MIRHLITGWSGRVARYYGFAMTALLVLTSCTPAPEAPLRIAIHAWPGYETLHLAQQQSYFNPSRIRLTEMANASQTSLALRNGTVEAGCLTLDEVLSLAQDGIDLRVVLVMDISDGADAVMARPDVAGLHALRGKRIALENGAVGAIMLDALLETANLKVSDIDLVPATVDEHEKIYQSGKVDAVVTFEPVRNALLKRGARVIFDSSEIPERIMDVLVVRNDRLAEHRQALKDIVAAHFHALEYREKQPQDAARILAPFLNVAEHEVIAQYDGLKVPTLEENHRFLSGAQPTLNSRAAELAELMLHHKLLQRKTNTAQLSDPGFLPEKK